MQHTLSLPSLPNDRKEAPSKGRVICHISINISCPLFLYVSYLYFSPPSSSHPLLLYTIPHRRAKCCAFVSVYGALIPFRIAQSAIWCRYVLHSYRNCWCHLHFAIFFLSCFSGSASVGTPGGGTPNVLCTLWCWPCGHHVFRAFSNFSGLPSSGNCALCISTILTHCTITHSKSARAKVQCGPVHSFNAWWNVSG